MAIIGQELKKWRDSLCISELDKYDITVANIILNNFDILQETGGIAGGKRITKFVELINDKKQVCDTCLTDISVNDSISNEKIKKITSLEVDSFRGFATSRKFILDKQYVFLYGPNGSGKTSFSEALEYGLLGNIEEAAADNIRLSAYIKNTYTNKGKTPVINCLFDDGSEGQAKTSYETYRFSFVEKNRIMDFSHISKFSAKGQNERMAALFGLSEFLTFVQGFTKNLDDRYLSISSKTEQTFKEAQSIRNQKKEELDRLEVKLKELNEEIQKSIADITKIDNTVQTIDQAIAYYDDADKGILTRKLQDKEKFVMQLVEYQDYMDIKSECKKIQDCLGIIRTQRKSLADKALEVNYKQLFEIVSKLDETNECPACGTKISRTVRNPYSYAKMKVNEYKEIDEIKQLIHEKAAECKKIIDKLLFSFEKDSKLLKLLGVNFESLNKVAVTDVETMEDSVKHWSDFLQYILGLVDDDINDKITQYNNIAKQKENSYLKEIEELREKEKALVTLETQLKDNNILVEDCKKFIQKFDNNSAETLLKIKREKEQAEFNTKIIIAYNKIISNLSSYMEKLPGMIAQDLEEKIVNYYNIINRGDADFEMLSDICLPKADSNKLILTFRDKNMSEALQVLSEGHIKILGLSILLAKAVKDNLNFIIFDDIVNAIDDEHRNGVADLLINNEDFKDVQIILSTHGDQFITKLKDRIGSSKSSKETIIYKFLPADSLQERGVVVEYSDAKTPIEAAKAKYDNNELKDAASKCRQAMESVSYNLWNKISRTADGQISVAMKSPKSQPDLYNIVDALIKKTKKISGMDAILSDMESIKKPDNWRVLNKGTHYEDEQPEFEREDIKNVLNLLINLDEQVRALKIDNSARL